MPTCLKCGDSFRNFVWIKGKRRNLCRRSFCLVCSPFGMHNTTKHPGRKEGPVHCIVCARQYIYKRHTGCTKDRCATCLNKSRHVLRKLRCVEYLGGKCVVCGYNRCPAAMAFHHRNPELKKFHIGGSECRSWSSVKAELNKCVLFCTRCHAEGHAGLFDLTKYYAAASTEKRRVS